MPNDRDVGTLDRSTYLGSSDIAAVLGISKWGTPLTVWREKMGMPTEEPDEERQALFRRGKRFEPVIFEMLEEDLGMKAERRNCRYRDPEYPWMAAEIDGEIQIDGEWVNLEAKSVHTFQTGSWGEEGTDEIPIYYYAQAVYGLMLTGRRRTIFAVLFGGDNLVLYEVHRDDETIAGMRRQAVAFWHNHVLAQTPPDPITYEDVCSLLRRDADTIIEADQALAQKLAAYKLAKAEEKAAAGRVEEMKYQIGLAVLGADALAIPSRKPKHVITVAGLPAMTIAYQQQVRIDSDAVRSRHPAVAAECSKTSSFFRYDLPRKGNT